MSYGLKDIADKVLRPPWSMHFIDDTDGLVHFAHEGYLPAKLTGTKDAVHPEMAYTRCGHVITWDGFRANAGTYVSRDVHLTCVPCAAGAREGRAQRQSFKQTMFAHLYGKNVTNVFAAYSEVERRIMYQWLRPPLYRRCARLAAVLYLKATEADRA